MKEQSFTELEAKAFRILYQMLWEDGSIHMGHDGGGMAYITSKNQRMEICEGSYEYLVREICKQGPVAK